MCRQGRAECIQRRVETLGVLGVGAYEDVDVPGRTGRTMYREGVGTDDQEVHSLFHQQAEQVQEVLVHRGRIT